MARGIVPCLPDNPSILCKSRVQGVFAWRGKRLYIGNYARSVRMYPNCRFFASERKDYP